MPPLSVAVLEHPEPWTEDEYFALGETADRIELIDGCLWLKPGSPSGHQAISSLLTMAVVPAARAVGFWAVRAVNLRLVPQRIVIPDLVVFDGSPLGDITEAAEVVLAGEITAPGTAALDRGLKMHFYAAARIGWYLLVEPDMTDYESVTLRLFRLQGEHYLEHAIAKHGEVLRSDLPFPLEISTEDLVDF